MSLYGFATRHDYGIGVELSRKLITDNIFIPEAFIRGELAKPRGEPLRTVDYRLQSGLRWRF